MDTSSLSKARITAFRATDNPDACDRFIDGHAKVLTSHGVNKVTSSNNDWKYNPEAYVILIETENGERVLGGSRVHRNGGNQELPLVEATVDLDPSVVDYVNKLRDDGVGEICGLWNSLEVAGMGVGSMFSIRSAVAILSQIDIQYSLALCSPYTARLAGNYGFFIEEGLGNNGTFYYPKIDLLATIVRLNDIHVIPNGSDFEKERIFDLRENPIQTKREKGRKGAEFQIEYNLKI